MYKITFQIFNNRLSLHRLICATSFVPVLATLSLLIFIHDNDIAIQFFYGMQFKFAL